MYPRNNASPEPIAIGAVIQISDGAVQTSGCTVRIRPIGVSEGAGAGTIAYTTDGVVMYTPTQGETNYTSFVLIASKAGCVPVAVTVVTTDAATPGRVRLDGVTHTSAVIPTVTAVTNRVTANADQWNGVSVTGMPMPTYTQPTGFLAANFGNLDAAITSRMASYTQPTGFLAADFTRLDAAVSSRMATYAQPTGFLAATFPTTVASPTNITGGTITTVSGNVNGNVAGSVGSVTGNVGGNVVGGVGSISGVTFPTNFASTSIDVSGRVLLQPTQTGVTIPTVTTLTNLPSIPANWLTAAGLAADAVTEIQSGLATSSQIPANFTAATFASAGVFATAALANAPSGSGPTASAIADAVWDEAISGHLTAGSTGAALNASGASGDPWSTVLPGSYVAGQAGYILDQIVDKTNLITSQSTFVTVDRVSGSTITMYYNESTSVTVPIDENTTGLTLRFVVENADGLDVLVIDNASVTRTSTNFTVTITTAVTATLGQYKWALRDITGGINRLVEGGVLQVQPAANRDA